MNHVFFGIIWVLAQILRLLYRIEVKGLENLPRNGVLLCPNHASDLDPVLIGICLPINYRLHFMAKEELFQNRLFGRILRALGALALLVSPQIEQLVSEQGQVVRALTGILLKVEAIVLVFVPLFLTRGR